MNAFKKTKNDNENIEIKTVITDSNLLITACVDLVQVRKYVTETAYLESKIMKLKRENKELKQKNKEAWLDYKDLRENYKTLDRVFNNIIDYKINANEFLSEKLEQVTMMKCDLEKQLKHKNQLWKTAFKAYKNLKKKVENKLFPIEFLDVGRTIIPDMPDFKNNVIYKFSIPWQKVKEYMFKKNKRGEK